MSTKLPFYKGHVPSAEATRTTRLHAPAMGAMSMAYSMAMRSTAGDGALPAPPTRVDGGIVKCRVSETTVVGSR